VRRAFDDGPEEARWQRCVRILHRFDCSHCRGSYSLRKDGTVRRHRYNSSVCPGSGERYWSAGPAVSL
jgi:hypothetical protein